MIPKEKMQEGIELCKRNIADYLKDARLVIGKGRLNHAYVSVQLSIEELGKIRMLREALSDNKNTKDVIAVKDTVFASHKGKSDKAWEFLDPKFRNIFGEVGFEDTGEGGFDPRGFDTITMAGHRTRLQCAFVDFHLDKWWLGRKIEEKKLIELINHIEERFSEA